MSMFQHFARVPPPSQGSSQAREKGMCQRFLLGKCPFSALACPYSHSKDHTPLCSRWKAGQCTGTTGNKCLYRHYYLERDAAPALAAHRPPLAEVQPSDFSSPLVCRVRKETLQHRREEVDIETGKRRSWVEEEEREVMDLTGDTPAKPKAVFKPVELPPAADSAASRPSTVTLPSSLPSSPYTLAPLSLPSSPCSPVDESTCPVCRREFSGARGVAAHRRHKNSKCKPGDQAQEPTKSSAVPVPATTAASTAAPAATTTATTATTATAAQEVITIPDTPETPATPATRATRDTRATRTPATPASTRTRRSLGLRLR